MQRRKSTTGFTLIELMITVAVVGILAAIAYPSYMDHIRKTRRAEAKSLLTSTAAREEQYFLDNKTYTSSMTALGYSADPMLSEQGYYNVSVQAATSACAISTCFVLQAVPVSGKSQASDSKCATFTLNSSGNKSTTGGGTGCW